VDHDQSSLSKLPEISGNKCTLHKDKVSTPRESLAAGLFSYSITRSY
jgi:hypothetical protein